jgi:prepilin-type N-terminal cleavage/methylation domain-containing protein
MRSRHSKTSHRRSDVARAGGFTLVELMIVVIIVVILATVAAIAYRRHLRSGRIVAAQEFVSRIQARQETYLQQHGSYADISTAGTFYPALSSPEPKAKPWTTPPNEWKDLGARPPANSTYFGFFVRASAGPNHPLDANASTLRIPAQPAAPMTPHPWYYVVAHGDLDGDATYANGGCSGASVVRPLACTLVTATSADSSIIVRQPGE